MAGELVSVCACVGVLLRLEAVDSMMGLRSGFLEA